MGLVWVLLLLTTTAVSVLGQQQRGGLPETVVITQFGPVIGIIQGSTVSINNNLNQEVRQFYNIPFAKPPTRFARSEIWTDTFDASNSIITSVQRPGLTPLAVRDATTIGSICPQPTGSVFSYNLSSLRQSESDCLNLNIFTPRQSRLSNLLPVYVWIHGGSFLTGSGNSYDMAALSSFSDGLVVVTINYRLGPLGFIAHPQLAAEDVFNSTGNYGLLDQQVALRWVQENIINFGGDPTRVTVGGESAGAISVYAHLVMPRSAGLFQQAISESGGDLDISPPAGLNNLLEYVALTSCANVSSDQLIGCLRGLPAAELVQAGTTVSNTKLTLFFGPYVDGSELPSRISFAVILRRFSRVPLLIGDVTYEGGVFVSGLGVLDATAYTGILNILYPPSFLPAVLQVYPPFTDGTDNRVVLSRLVDDFTFRCPSRMLATAMTAARRPVYQYRFNPLPTCRPASYPAFDPGAFHAADVAFTTPLYAQFYAVVNCTFSPQEEVLSTQMLSYWYSFIKRGHPNGLVSTSSASLIQWQKFSIQRQNSVVLDVGELSTEVRYQLPTCQFWDNAAFAGFNFADSLKNCFKRKKCVPTPIFNP